MYVYCVGASVQSKNVRVYTYYYTINIILQKQICKLCNIYLIYPVGVSLGQGAPAQLGWVLGLSLLPWRSGHPISFHDLIQNNNNN